MGRGKSRKHDHDAILKDWLAGLSTKELAAKHGCPGNLGAVLAKKRGVKRSPEVIKQASERRSRIGRETIKASAAGKKLEKRNQRIVDYVKRHKIQSAAEKFGLTEAAVRIIAKRHGWQKTQLDHEAILAEYLAGASLASLAEKYGCHKSYPSRLLGHSTERRTRQADVY